MTNPKDAAPDEGAVAEKRAAPYTVAITGSIACGKSEVRKILQELGIPVIDADRLGHELLDAPGPAYQAVLDRFGADLADPPGAAIDRKKLGKIIFSDPKAKDDLEAIMHPAIEKLCEERVAALAGNELVAVEVSLLFESGQEAKYNEIWCVLLDGKQQKKRLLERTPALTEADADARISSQWPQEKKAALSHRVIDNSGTREETKVQVERCLELARQAARKGDPKPATPADPSRNAEYRQILEKFAQLATEEVLGRMGDVSTTNHKDAEAQLSMKVCANQAGADGKGQTDEHQLKVNLRMCVSNTRGAGSPQSCDTVCSCNCGDTCRKTCACASDCGCSCKSPSPPPPAPKPTDPPPPPQCPPPSKGGNCGAGGLGIFLGFLAFLFAVGALTALIWFHPWNRPADPVTPPCGKNCQNPVTVIVDCKGSCESKPCPGVCPPVTPTPPPIPTPTPPPPTSGCSEANNPSSTPPAFILPYLHNQVRVRVTQWTVRCRANDQGAQVVGRDDRGRLVNVQEYGPSLRFSEQWIMNYSRLGDQTWVDLFHAPNQFMGRTIYEYDRDGRLLTVRRLDSHQRPVISAAFERNPDYSLCRVVVRRYNEHGVVIDQQISWNRPDFALMTGQFYQYELFGQFK